MSKAFHCSITSEMCHSSCGSSSCCHRHFAREARTVAVNCMRLQLIILLDCPPALAAMRMPGDIGYHLDGARTMACKTQKKPGLLLDMLHSKGNSIAPNIHVQTLCASYTVCKFASVLICRDIFGGATTAPGTSYTDYRRFGAVACLDCGTGTWMRPTTRGFRVLSTSIAG